MAMKAVKQRVAGRIFEVNGRYALLLQNARPEPDDPHLLYLRWAFITLGAEEPIFPAILLDDWGSEITSLSLYNWIDEFGSRFPRAELFGFDAFGQETQLFLRELEPHSRWPCYAYPAAGTPVREGMLIEAILLPNTSVTEPMKIKRPSWVELPLRRAQVQWWQVPPAIQTAVAVLT